MAELWVQVLRRKRANMVSICQADLGLAEPVTAFQVALNDVLFQSARQIWVWPNRTVAIAAGQGQKVSICQADLGLAERNDAIRAAALFAVSICQADLGLAELYTPT